MYVYWRWVQLFSGVINRECLSVTNTELNAAGYRKARVLRRTTAERLGASGVWAEQGVGVLHGDEAAGAREVRAERLAALGNLARLALALRSGGVRDGGEVVRALNGVAERVELFNICDT